MTMDIQDILNRSLALAKKLRLKQEEALQRLSNSLHTGYSYPSERMMCEQRDRENLQVLLNGHRDKPCDKVAVIGDFKAGKSTLINRLFLKDALLPTDYQECTAVPTRIMSGAPGLQIWKRDAAGVETLVRSVSELSADNLKSETTAGSAAARDRLTKECSFVVVSRPGVLPGNICMVDTPGLNSTSSSLMLNTMWEARDADALLYVVRAKQLSLRETELIASLCGLQSPQVPLFVVVTHASTLSAARAQFIAEQIQAQLQNSGVRCCGCGTMELSAAAPASPGKRLFEDEDLWSDTAFAPAPAPTAEPADAQDEDLWGDAAAAPAPTPAPTGEPAGLEDALRRFFAESVQEGRQAKILRELRLLLPPMQMAVQAKLSVADKSAEDVARLQRDLELLRYDYRQKVERLLLNIKEKQNLFSRGAEQAIERLVEERSARLAPLNTLGNVVGEIQRWEEEIPRQLKQETDLLSDRLKMDVSESLRNFGATISVPEVGSVVPEYDAGFLAKIPSWCVVVADYALCEIVSPLPFLIDIPLRFLCGNLPFLPANIAANMAKKMAESNLREMADKIKSDLQAQMNHSIEQMAAELRAKLAAGDYFEAQEQALKEAEVKQLSESEKLSLRQAEQELGELVQSLN